MTSIRSGSINSAPTGVHAKYIGRVGALAVALGIGAAMATTPWAALAKPSDSDSPRPNVSASTDGETREQKGPPTSSSTDDKGPVAFTPGDNSSATATGGNSETATVSGGNSDATTVSGGNSDATTATGGNDAASVTGDNTVTLARPKPIKGHSTGSVSINTADDTLSGEESGVSSQFGKYTLSLQGNSTTSNGTVSSSGDVTIVAANGDRVTGTFTLTGPADSELTAVVTITGGTGRFANATGTLTVICAPSGPPSQQGQVIVIKHDCTTEGGISY